jgi:hypothetical protein
LREQVVPVYSVVAIVTAIFLISFLLEDWSGFSKRSRFVIIVGIVIAGGIGVNSVITNLPNIKAYFAHQKEIRSQKAEVVIKTDSSLTLVQFNERVQRRIEQERGIDGSIPPELAFAFSVSAISKTRTHLKDGPSEDSKVISVIEKNTRVVVQNKAENEWFFAAVDGETGWVNGSNFRLMALSEVPFSDIWDHALEYAFPEESLSGKVFGWLLGFPISLLIRTVVVRLGLDQFFKSMRAKLSTDSVVFLGTLIYYFAKNSAILDTKFGTLEQKFLMLFILVSSIISSLPVNLFSLLMRRTLTFQKNEQSRGHC